MAILDSARAHVENPKRDGLRDIKVPIVIGADGRFSTVRERAGLVPHQDIATDGHFVVRINTLAWDVASGPVLGGFGMGRVLAVFDRFDRWQVRYVFPKGTYQKVRAECLDSLRRSIAAIEPRLTEHVG